MAEIRFLVGLLVRVPPGSNDAISTRFGLQVNLDDAAVDHALSAANTVQALGSTTATQIAARRR